MVNAPLAGKELPPCHLWLLSFIEILLMTPIVNSFDCYRSIPVLKEAFVLPVTTHLPLGALPNVDLSKIGHLLNGVHGYLDHVSVPAGQGLREMLVNSIQACNNDGKGKIALGYRPDDAGLNWSFCIDANASGMDSETFYSSFAAIFNPGGKTGHSDKNRGVGFKAASFAKSTRVVVATRCKFQDYLGQCRVYTLAKGIDGKYFHAEVIGSKFWGGQVASVEDAFGNMAKRVYDNGGTAIYVLGEDETAGNFVARGTRSCEVATCANSIIWAMPKNINATAINVGIANTALNTKSINGLKYQLQEWGKKGSIQYKEIKDIKVTTEHGHDVLVNIHYASVPDKEGWKRSHNQTWAPKRQILMADNFDVFKSKDNSTALIRAGMNFTQRTEVIIEVVEGAEQNDSRSQLATDQHINDTVIDPFHLCFAEAVRQHRPDFVLEEIKEEKDKASLNMNLGSRIGKLMRQLAQKIKEQQYCINGIIEELGKDYTSGEQVNGRKEASETVNQQKKQESSSKKKPPATQVKLSEEGKQRARKIKAKGQLLVPSNDLSSCDDLIRWSESEKMYLYNIHSQVHENCISTIGEMLGLHLNDSREQSWRDSCVAAACVHVHLDYLETQQAGALFAAKLSEMMEPIMKAQYSLETLKE